MNDTLYARMGIDMKKLGCVMLGVSDLGLHKHVPDTLWYSDPETPWINGPETNPHITLLFGLMESAHKWRPYVDEVLTGWTPPEALRIRGFARFGSPDAPYDAVVGILDHPELHDAHRRLSRLPHINTFPYQPHVTIGWVLKGAGKYIIRELGDLRGPHEMLPGELHYGDQWP